MKKSYLIIGLITVIVSIAVFTNPNDNKHKSAVKSKILSPALGKPLNTTTNDTDQASLDFRTMIIKEKAEQAINSSVSAGNYILFSTTRVTLNGETSVIGFGAFGNVYLSDKLNKAIKNGLGWKQEKTMKELENEKMAKVKMDSLYNSLSKSNQDK